MEAVTNVKMTDDDRSDYGKKRDYLDWIYDDFEEDNDNLFSNLSTGTYS